MNKEEIVKADKELRNKIIVVIIVAAASATALMLYAESYIENAKLLSETSPQKAIEKLLTLVYIISVLMTAATLSIGYYLLNLFTRIYKQERIPPENMKVIRDTKIMRGKKAKKRAVFGFILSLLIIICGCLIPWFTYKLIHLVAMSYR